MNKMVQAYLATLQPWVWVAAYFGLWAVDIIWCVVTGRLMNKGVLKENVHSGGLALLAFIAGMVAVGFSLYSLKITSAVGVLILWAICLFAVGFTSMGIGNITSGKTWLGDWK